MGRRNAGTCEKFAYVTAFFLITTSVLYSGCGVNSTLPEEPLEVLEEASGTLSEDGLNEKTSSGQDSEIVSGIDDDHENESGTLEGELEEGQQENRARYYENGTLLRAGKQPDFQKDVKKLSEVPSGMRLTDYPKGYEITVSRELKLDFSLSPDFAKLYNENLEVRICRDRSPYLDVDGWLSSMPNSYVKDPRYIESNNLVIHQDQWVNIGENKVRILSLTRNPSSGSTQTKNSYTYAYINTGGLVYYTIHFKSTSHEQYMDEIETIIGSFRTIEPKGSSVYSLNLKPVMSNWNEETTNLYERIRNLDHVWWGLFTPNPFAEEGKEKIAEIEEKLDFKFPVIMWYRYLGHDFPAKGMQEAYDNQKLVELTYQIAVGDLYGRNPNFDVLDGLKDDEIRRFARQAKEFGHPFLLRLNNEMNSTWVSYSGHSSLADPDIFRQVWQRVYSIFEEEGVDNAIWIFNPNDVSYPPCKWNTHLAYYPGNEYVHMIGLTGYNTGDYFKDHTGERWRSFAEIYDRLWYEYKVAYSQFPWIITEFASSSVGGDKEVWIEDMFVNLPRYKNIKIAVWWSYYDADPRPETKGTPARRYWLDEKPEYLDAFKRGLVKSLAD